MPTDANVFDKIKTFADYNKADQAFQLQKQIQQQQLQTGGIDAASKSNIYATQVLSGAVAGGQPAYDQAKQQLQQQGIDVSNWAPDVETGAKQAQQARLAQSPLGSLLNAGLKVDSNNIALGGLNGKVPELNGIGSVLGGGIIAPAQTAAPQQQGNPPAPIMVNGRPQAPANMDDLLNQQSEPAQPVEITRQTNKFNPPKQNPNETLSAYNSRVQQAFEAFKSDPNYIQASAEATAMGKDKAEAAKAAIGAKANYDQVVQTVNGIKSLNDSADGLPQDRGFVSAKAKAYLAQNLGDTAVGSALGVPPQALADNNNAFNKLNEAQTIGAIKELASTGQIRMTRTLENILNKGYLIDPGASKASKEQQANLILTELENSKIAAQNVNAGLSGDTQTPLNAMPSPAQATPKIGTAVQGADGTYIFNGGDPSKPESWKKVN